MRTKKCFKDGIYTEKRSIRLKSNCFVDLFLIMSCCVCMPVPTCAGAHSGQKLQVSQEMELQVVVNLLMWVLEVL